MSSKQHRNAKHKRKGLIKNHQNFCIEYVRGGNAREAYMLAYPKANPRTACNEGWRLLQRPDIQKFIESLQREVTKDLAVTIEDIIKRLYGIATFDIRQIVATVGESGPTLKPFEEWPAEAFAIIESVNTRYHGDGISSPEIKLPAKGDALKALLGHFDRLKVFGGGPGGAKGKATGAMLDTALSLAETNLALAQQLKKLNDFPGEDDTDAE